MTGPDRIWAWISNYKPQGVSLSGGPPDDTIEYIRRDRDALAALPEVQALIRQAVEAERGARHYDGGALRPIASAPITPPPPKG